MDTLNEILAGMQAKTDAATPGPWHGTTVESVAGGTIYDSTVAIASVAYDVEPVDSSIRRFRTEQEADANAAFIAMARTAMPALLSAVQNVLALCDDPGGPDSWSHTFDGRQSIFADDVRKALIDALEASE